jgi:hypothetical protein
MQSEIDRLRALNRKLIWTLILLLIGGTITWIALLFEMHH